MEKLKLFSSLFEKSIGQTVFIISLALITFALVVDLLITFFSAEYKKKNRTWFCLFCFGLVLLSGGIALLNGEGMGYALLLFGISVLYCIPVFFLSEKRRKLKKEQTELIRFLDSQINSQTHSQILPKRDKNLSFNIDDDKKEAEQENLEQKINKDKKPIALKNLEATSSLYDNKECDIPDFSHVKKVIERLNCYSLSPFDKKQVKELEANIEMAKNDLDIIKLKSKINDGLTILLKIMSKYGV